MDILKNLVKIILMPVKQFQFIDNQTEYEWLCEEIQRKLKAGHMASEIAVVARDNVILENLSEVLNQAGIDFQYERKFDLLKDSSFQGIYNVLEFINSFYTHTPAETTYLVEILGMEIWGLEPKQVWEIARYSYDSKQDWLAYLAGSENDKYRYIAELFFFLAKHKENLTFLEILDVFTGNKQTIHNLCQNKKIQNPEVATFFNDYYFASQNLDSVSLSVLNILKRVYKLGKKLKLENKNQLSDFLNYIKLYQKNNLRVNVTINEGGEGVYLYTAHKVKGMEFETVFVLDANQSVWFKKGKPRKIPLPKNLPIEPAKDDFEDILKIFFVACTRAKENLYILTSQNFNEKTDQPLEFLDHGRIELVSREVEKSEAPAIIRQKYLTLTKDQKSLLEPYLENYIFSISHLNSFLDLEFSGPSAFLKNTLLKFPRPTVYASSYGTAFHKTLRYYHQSLKGATAANLSDLKAKFNEYLQKLILDTEVCSRYLEKGLIALERYTKDRLRDIQSEDMLELNFHSHGLQIAGTGVTGAIDRLKILGDDKVQVIDFKTGKAISKLKIEKEFKDWRYFQQLVFYNYLVSQSTQTKHFEIVSSVLDFVEAEQNPILETQVSSQDIQDQLELIQILLTRIQNLDFPEIEEYSADSKGSFEFLEDLRKGKI